MIFFGFFRQKLHKICLYCLILVRKLVLVEINQHFNFDNQYFFNLMDFEFFFCILPLLLN